MSFLDVLITRTRKGFKASAYHNPRFSGVYSKFNSFISEEYKVGFIFTLSLRQFSIVSDFSRFLSEEQHLKEILKKNAFSIKLINSCIKQFLKERLPEKPFTLTAEKKDLVIVLPFLGKLSLDLRTRLKTLSVIFKSLTCISNFFQFKEKTPYCLCSNVVNKFSCGRCNATYYGELSRHLSVRVREHYRVFHF